LNGLSAGDTFFPVGDRTSAIDIVIVNYNSTDHLLRCLESVYASLQGIRAEVYVQDNGSKDDVGRVTSLFPRVHLFRPFVPSYPLDTA
jgi:GT2 family glycosyltransferase